MYVAKVIDIVVFPVSVSVYLTKLCNKSKCLIHTKVKANLFNKHVQNNEKVLG